MSGYLDRLEQQLIEAALAGAPGQQRRTRRRRMIPASAAAVLAALLVASAVALAVTGTFTTGSVVRAPERPVAGAGAGIAVHGTSLLPARVVDPAAGLPWGMRLVHTTRRLVCLQVGRVEGTQLGLLGQDGAFGNDGHFHAVAPDVVGYNRETTEVSTCLTPGQTTSQEARIPQSGVFGSPHSRSIPVAARRWISYGLLGPAAVSVTYRWAGETHTVPVEPHSGAYLVVLSNPAKGGFETGGGAVSTSRFVTPQGVISSITYRANGKTCDESRPTNETTAAQPHCPRERAAPVPRGARHLNRAIHARVFANGTAIVTFTAPHTISSALSDYTVEVPSPCHHGTSGTPVERDLRAGQTVHVTVRDIFANACGQTVTVRVVYEKNRNRFALGEAEVVVGETSIRR
jgi:hypothetical protein